MPGMRHGAGPTCAGVEPTATRIRTERPGDVAYAGPAQVVYPLCSMAYV